MLQAGRTHPIGDLHRQTGRQRWPKDHRHVYIGHAIGEHGKDGQAQALVKRRQGRQHKSHDAAIAQTGRDLAAPGDVGLRQDCQRHQHQEGHFLGDQSQRQRDAHRVVQDQEIGRVVPAGGPRRDQPHEPARGRHQKGQPQCGGGMGQRQQGRQDPAKGYKARPIMQGGNHQDRNRQRRQRRNQPCADRQGKCAGQAGPLAKRCKSLAGHGWCQRPGQPGCDWQCQPGQH